MSVARQRLSGTKKENNVTTQTFNTLGGGGIGRRARLFPGCSVIDVQWAMLRMRTSCPTVDVGDLEVRILPLQLFN